jgi:hypothetical protein
MKRTLAVLVVTLAVVGAAPVAATASTGVAPVAGLWSGVDVADGSTMYLAIGQGATPTIFLYDTQTRLCAGPGWLAGSAVLDGNLVVIRWRTGLECVSGGSFGSGGTDLTPWTYDPATDTITTSAADGNGTIGSVFHRLRL